MTKDEESAVQVVKDDLPVAEDEKPFQVVLIDIKKAAKENVIHCIEKTLMGTEDLKFVAISYRWGELQETTVDTQVGYLASITSFDLDSFFLLCRTMTAEVHLKHMDYVWVDAICVDQTNYDKRKATIYQMTNIYERANYIVAVPDLHVRHLENVNKKNAEIIQETIKYSTYLYHLIHGNTKQLVACDEAFLNEQRVPTDPHLRYLLTNYTDHFADGFTTCKEHDQHYDADHTLDHIYETNLTSQKKTKQHHGRKLYKKILNKMGYGDDDDERRSHLDAMGVNELHKCDKVDACPLMLFGGGETDTCGGRGESDEKYDHHYQRHRKRNHLQDDMDTMKWKRMIPERSASIRQSMDFLSDLIQDWSTRVWVISEYHIAKRKKSKKMKYWFIQLGSSSFGPGSFPHGHDSFFEFDFYGDSLAFSSSSASLFRVDTQDTVGRKRKHDAILAPVYQTFHSTVQQQLNHQTFLEMILKSKASRNEDRMHAILPLSPDYKHKIASKNQVSQWHITNLISVKLQLYDWASTKHKWQLLFLSSFSNHMGGTLPTFATSTIAWPSPANYPTLHEQDKCNFDLTNDDSIQLVTLDNGSKKLVIKPKEYYQHKNYQKILLSGHNPKDEAMLRRLLHLNTTIDLPDMICIPDDSDHIFQQDTSTTKRDGGVTHCIYLIGCFAKNKWILKFEKTFRYYPVANLQKWEHHVCDDMDTTTTAGFDIY
ncbi:unnamed protein product [Absidia cylindrospora]